jgi:hypothetical protein
MKRLAAFLAHAFDAWRNSLPLDPCPPLRVLPPQDSAIRDFPGRQS